MRDLAMNVLVILAHPRNASFCGGLAQAYAEGARTTGMKVVVLRLGDLRFDPDVRRSSPCQQALEPDLERARQLIEWADHLTLVFPAWWGVGPARMKAFFDRVLLPGFAFRVQRGGRFEGLLTGRTAHLVATMDMPPWVYRLVYRAPGSQALRRSTLGFCGIETTRTLMFGPVKDSTPAARNLWLAQARRLGASLQYGGRRCSQRTATKLLAWLKALRLHFYPMTWMAYTVGALGAAAATGHWNQGYYLLGYAFLFLLEAATVFVNEWFDYDSDRRNRYYGPFTGGSRVLVNGELTFRELRAGIAATLLAATASLMLLPANLLGDPVLVLALLGLSLLALGYTFPPVKLSWRGWGELDVAVTHSLGVVLIGYLLQGGAWHDPFPWLVSLPLLLAVLPAIILAGIPDAEADRQAGKRTLAVQLGRQRAMALASIFAVAAALLAVLLQDHPALQEAFRYQLWSLPHTVLLLALLYREWRHPPGPRIDTLLAVSLAHIAWFTLVPMLQLSAGPAS